MSEQDLSDLVSALLPLLTNGFIRLARRRVLGETLAAQRRRPSIGALLLKRLYGRLEGLAVLRLGIEVAPEIPSPQGGT